MKCKSSAFKMMERFKGLCLSPAQYPYEFIEEIQIIDGGIQFITQDSHREHPIGVKPP